MIDEMLKDIRAMFVVFPVRLQTLALMTKRLGVSYNLRVGALIGYVVFGLGNGPLSIAQSQGSASTRPSGVGAEIPPRAMPSFEVASIRPNPTGGNKIEVTPGKVTLTSARMATCIKWAYGVQNSQISGANATASGRLNSERYDIVAKASDLVPETQLKLMFQTLLADRFKFAFHKQTQEMQVYALVTEKNGPKLGKSDGEGESVQQAKSKLVRQWTRTTMTQLAESLSEAMERPVLDQTGLSAKYDFSLDLAPYLPTTGERPDIPGMMVTAIREQLGLKMESRRAPVDVMIVDHLDTPSPN